MRYLKWTVDLAIALCLCLLALVTVPPMLGYQVYAVISRSMSPALEVGSAVYVRAEKFEDIQVGDIITFLLGESRTTVTHRVVGKDEAEQTFVTQGDANDQPDGRQTGYSDVIGVVKFSLPYFGCFAVLLDGICEKLIFAGILLWLMLADGILSGRTHIRIREEAY